MVEKEIMRKLLTKCLLLVASALVAPLCSAQEVSPDALLSAATAEVIAIIKQQKDPLAGNSTRIAELVESKILPLFDFTRMTQIAVARNWRIATPEQQKALTAEFRTLLVRTYSTALSNYRDQVIEFKRLRAAPEDIEVTVKSVIKQPGTDALTMDYSMEKVAAGWKVYDIKIDGISLIANYRETFAEKVREGGVDGLIKALADKNRPGDSRAKRQSLSIEELLILHAAAQGFARGSK
jgi:phospholipid transport system substrate-binding protein